VADIYPWKRIFQTVQSAGFKGAIDDYSGIATFLEEKNIALAHNGVGVNVLASFKAWEDQEQFLLERESKALGAPMAMRTGATSRRVGESVGVDIASREAHHANPQGVPANNVVVYDRTAHEIAENIFSHGPGQFLKAVKMAGRGQPSQALMTWTEKYDQVNKATLSTYSNETSGVDGGVAVPPQYIAGIESQVMGQDAILPKTRQIQAVSNSATINIDDTAPWNNSGGIRVFWRGETSTITQSKVSLKQRDFRLKSIACLVPVTDELEEDAPAIPGHIFEQAGAKMSYEIDRTIVRGDGVTQPHGFLSANSLITISKETSQTAATICAPNVIKMWTAMLPQWRRNAYWIANPDVFPSLSRLSLPGRKDSTTTPQAWGSLMWQPANGLSGSPFETLMGRPILYHQAASTLGTVGDFNLVALDQIVCFRRDMKSAYSIHIFFDQLCSAYRFSWRLDAQTLLPGALSAANGSQTYSPVVTLATRA
jgi:HK97 family phage major capsid protein